MKLKLGYTPSYELERPEPEEKEEETEKKPRVYLPSLTIRGDAAETLIGKRVKAGDTITATVTFKVTETVERTSSRQEYSYMDDGCRVELEAENLDIDGMSDRGEESEETAEDAVDGYLRGKNKKD